MATENPVTDGTFTGFSGSDDSVHPMLLSGQRLLHDEIRELLGKAVCAGEWGPS